MTAKTIIITGASRGLGLAIARDAAELGANVVLFARSADKLEQEAQAIREIGAKALAVPGDISQEADCRRLVDKTSAHFGRIDALVNNAGVIEPIAPVAEASIAAWRQNLLTNVLGPVMLTQAALPYLRQHRGRVINVSSGAATYAIPGWGAYCTAKGALNQFNRVLSIEEEMVTSIAVRPGVIDTDMQAVIHEMGATGMPESAYQRFAQMRDAGELLPPEVPGGTIAVLALFAPREWDGEFVAWDEERVQELVRKYATRREG
ncbi:MAG: SDR family NAD(P)-dependent oxidoreductase [Chloroflexi bacterium]|nr:SDR family NAD(P)-dependent oxidoreductase [Chloroflexota bacterium]